MRSMSSSVAVAMGIPLRTTSLPTYRSILPGAPPTYPKSAAHHMPRDSQVSLPTHMSDIVVDCMMFSAVAMSRHGRSYLLVDGLAILCSTSQIADQNPNAGIMSVCTTRFCSALLLLSNVLVHCTCSLSMHHLFSGVYQQLLLVPKLSHA